MEPHRGYWIYVFSAQDVVIRFPSIFENFVRSNDDSPAWQQTDKQWRLQLAARGSETSDNDNHVGITTSADAATKLRRYEPPVAPIDGALSLSIVKDINGTASRLAQSINEGGARQEFRIAIDSRKSGPVTVTWPNLSTIPKNVKVRLVDVATNESRDLRKTSGYTFQAEGGLTREFKIQMEQGSVSKAVIGTVQVTRSGRSGGADAAVRLTYSLTGPATTSVRITSATGKEIMSITRGRADAAGQNEVVWNLRDQANRPVPAGNYQAEIIAEGEEGERVRRIVPIFVSR